MGVIDFFRNRTKYITIKNYYGEDKIMTVANFYNTIMKQSQKRDYNWIAPTSELVRLCKTKGFPRECSIDIEIAILNCFANIEARVNRGGDKFITKTDDAHAVQFCYDDLGKVAQSTDDKELNKTINSVRTRYLKEMISSAVNTSTRGLYFRCKALRDLQNEVFSRNFNKYSKMEESFNLIDMYEEVHNEASAIFSETNNREKFMEEENNAMFGIVKSLDGMFSIAKTLDYCEKNLNEDMFGKPKETDKDNHTINDDQAEPIKGLIIVKEDVASK